MPSDSELELSLYDLTWCPFCARVRQAADKLGIHLDLIDVAEDPSARQTLIDQLGRGTVPVLRIRERGQEILLPESRDIIAYLGALKKAGTALKTPTGPA